jgi:two-component system cell cycle sensor histidine kinase/response regulator CckA
VYIDPSMRRMLRLAAETQIQAPSDLDTLIQFEGQRSFLDVLNLSNENGKWSGEASCRLSDNHAVLLDVRVQSLAGLDGEKLGSLVVARDVTREKSMEKQVILSQQMELVENFIGSIAHEFKNLLTVLMAYATLLKDNTKGLPCEDDADRILETAQKANELTTRMMAVTRPTPPRMENLDVFIVLNDLVAILRKTLPANIDVVAPETKTLPRVYCDPTILYRALLNLCLNARDAMPNGGRLTVEIDWICLEKEDLAQWPDRLPGVYMILAVTDTGAGIPPEIKEHIFEPFFTTKKGGTGLGLSVVQHTLKLMGGWITAASQVGKGSCFRVYLPASQQEGVFIHVDSEEGEPAQGTETLMAVDDDPVTLSMIQRFLQKSGFTIWAVSSGEEALRVYRQHADEIKLVLMDVVMPGMNGEELYRELCKVKPKAPVLLMSGFPLETVERLIQESQAPFVAKPFSRVHLTREIRRVLDNGKM